MKAVIIDTFNYFDIRTKYVRDILIDKGYDVTMIVSDFDHITKNNRIEDREQTIFIPTKPYYKNISIARLKSHIDFSKKVYKQLLLIKSDFIYSLIPVNSLAKLVHKYKKKYKQTKVYFDIYDLWPESMPVMGAIKKILFPWQNLRDKHLKCADKIFLECSYYKKFLPKKLNYTVAYLCKEERIIEYKNSDKTLSFLYLGSINNIIDIDGIVSLLSEVNRCRTIHLEIIGGGESDQEFVNKLISANIPYTNHGVIFNEEKKDEIISHCHFGLNMYKKGLCIGLTMKSLDYFSRGLPVINGNIYDTGEIIDKYNCGVNSDSANFRMTIDALINCDFSIWSNMHNASLKVQQDLFTIKRAQQVFSEDMV